MVIDGLDAASAAFSVGYESARQFNREYGRFFGLPPIKHLRTVRASSSLRSLSQLIIETQSEASFRNKKARANDL